MDPQAGVASVREWTSSQARATEWRTVAGPARPPCPGLTATIAGIAASVHPAARLSDLDRVDVRLRCLARPGVLLAPDYVVDICLDRAYCDSCLFLQARPALED
jgi:hypothetical protein